MTACIFVVTFGLAFLMIALQCVSLQNVEKDLKEYLRRVKAARDASDPRLRVHFDAQVRALMILIMKHFSIEDI